MNRTLNLKKFAGGLLGLLAVWLLAASQESELAHLRASPVAPRHFRLLDETKITIPVDSFFIIPPTPRITKENVTADYAAAENENPATIPVPCFDNPYYDWGARHEEVLRLKEETNHSYVLVGDSITHFWGGETWDELFGGKALNLGFGADRTENVLWRIDNGEMDGISPEFVIVNIGTNNFIIKHNTPDQVVGGILKVLERLEAKVPEAKIILMGIFPVGWEPNTPFRQMRKDVNAKLPSVIKDFGNVQFVDISSNFLDENGYLSGSIFGDSIHPTQNGYKIWADSLRPLLTE